MSEHPLFTDAHNSHQAEELIRALQYLEAQLQDKASRSELDALATKIKAGGHANDGRGGGTGGIKAPGAAPPGVRRSLKGDKKLRSAVLTSRPLLHVSHSSST